MVVYGLLTFLIVPVIAPIFGRERIRHSDKITPTNYLTVVLNRNYVVPELNDLLEKTAEGFAGSGLQINYLDANFPFLDNFPLLPHLSHDDGKKIDLSFVYETAQGEITKSQKSISGYGVFEAPGPGESNQTGVCLDRGYSQYDLTRYLSFGSKNRELEFSEVGTRELITRLLENPDLGKIFIEPHLKNRMGLKSKRIRFHGCQAVRHDDHIHIQLK